MSEENFIVIRDIYKSIKEALVQSGVFKGTEKILAHLAMDETPSRRGISAQLSLLANGRKCISLIGFCGDTAGKDHVCFGEKRFVI